MIRYTCCRCIVYDVHYTAISPLTAVTKADKCVVVDDDERRRLRLRLYRSAAFYFYRLHDVKIFLTIRRKLKRQQVVGKV